MSLIDAIGEPGLDELIDRIVYLRGRWQDEREHEDFNEYAESVRKCLPAGCSFVSLTKRPFKCIFTKDGIKYFVSVTASEAKWGHFNVYAKCKKGDKARAQT